MVPAVARTRVARRGARGARALTGRSVVQVTLWNSPYLGNVMWSQLALAQAVRARFGLRTHLVLAHGAAAQPWIAELDAAAVSWSILPAQRRRWRRHLMGVVRDHDAALIDAHFTAADLHAAAVAAAAGIPCLWHIRTGFGGYSLRQRAKDVLKLRIAARRGVARIVAVSPWLAELMRRRGAPAERIDVIPNAIVSERFAQLPARAAARERFGLRPDATVVLGLGWWPEAKGVDVLIDALEPLARRHPELQVLLVGEERMRAFLDERLPDPPLWLRCSGFISDAAWLFAAADVFVSASRHEGQSSAVGESLACGLPVVLSDIPGTALWSAAPGVRTFRSGAAHELADRLEELLAAGPDGCASLGAPNRAWVADHVSIDAWCARLCDVYAPLLTPPRGARARGARRRDRRT